MRKTLLSVATVALLMVSIHAQQPAPAPAAPDPIRTLIGRLELEKYKATVKGLTQFGDRRQGTDRNRAALDWIEAQLKSYGCANVERIGYVYTTPPPNPNRGNTPRAPADPNAIPTSQGGGRPRGIRSPTGVNTDPMKQPNEKLRALNSQPATDGPREDVYCTKIGSHTSRGGVHHRRPHGRPRLGRSGQRRWFGDGVGDGAGPGLQLTGRGDRSIDSLRVVEQRGNGTERQPRLRRATRPAAGQGESAGVGPLP